MSNVGSCNDLHVVANIRDLEYLFQYDSQSRLTFSRYCKDEKGDTMSMHVPALAISNRQDTRALLRF